MPLKNFYSVIVMKTKSTRQHSTHTHRVDVPPRKDGLCHPMYVNKLLWCYRCLQRKHSESRSHQPQNQTNNFLSKGLPLQKIYR